uniref:selenocysteine insertion sequence-binding protein 2 isoform X3 n=1 Tax=Jaculus jaculus TaxID=51337 RepID=UPI001E1B4C58|nr:selenocysteine insertion sequence-binding protein 2 isoform X3 [Jaculus jaculus]
MASERPREPGGEDSIKLSADVKPFVPKFAGLNVPWFESSEACVFPSCAATYYPFVQESPVTEQKIYPEDIAFRTSTFPGQYLSSEMTLHPYAYPAYALESTQNICSVPASQCNYNQVRSYPGFQAGKPRNERMGPQETKAAFKQKKSYEERKIGGEQKFNHKRADGVMSEIKSAKGSHHLSSHEENSLKSDGCHKRTDRKSRPAVKSTPTSKPEFEFSRLDFPELQSPKNNIVSEMHKQPRWGPLRSATSDISLLEVGTAVKEMSQGEMVRSNQPGKAAADSSPAGSPSCTRELSWTPMGYIVRQTVSSESSPVPKNVTSMINLKMVASSAEAKNSTVTSPGALSAEASHSREKHGGPHGETQSQRKASKMSKVPQSGELEQNEASRKNKKKKEKSQLNCEIQSNYEILTVQEPPRIEDAEEFPNLAAVSERRYRVDSPKFQSKQLTQNDFKPSGKKSQVPVQLDLGGMLEALEKKQRAPHAKQPSRPIVFSVGAVPVLSKEATSGERSRRSDQIKTPHNPLDSSAPLIKKGKQREVPKAKKPTSLKKIILKERQEKKQQRLQENAMSPAVVSDDARDAESGANDQAPDDQTTDVQAPDHTESTGLERTEESTFSIPEAEGKSEELLGTELQRDAEACQPTPDLATFPRIHSRRFRDYCSQMLSKEVDACVTDLLKELVRFQDRMYQKDPVKAKTKRRFVLGLREVLKHLKLRKLKCVIISPNCEKIQSKGGLDETLHTIIDSACEQNIPFVFALNRKALGRSLNKAVPVSVVGIFSYDGVQDQFHKMVELTVAARQAYKTMLENVRQELAGEPCPQTPPSPPTKGPSCSAKDGAPAPTGKEPRYKITPCCLFSLSWDQPT